MGVGGAWLAVRGMAPDDVLHALKLKRTGESAELCGKKTAAAALPPAGWYVVWDPVGTLDDDQLAAVSVGGEAVACAIEEHAGYYASAHWRDGAQLWQVTRGMDMELTTEGALPPSYEPLRDRLFAEQKAGDLRNEQIDHTGALPLDLAEELTGFRHDTLPDGMTSLIGDLLEWDLPPAPPTAPPTRTIPKKPWWKFW